MFDRETMMMIAMVITLAGTVYMFREFQKQKQEITNVKYYVSRKLSSTSQPVRQQVAVEEAEEPEEAVDSDED